MTPDDLREKAAFNNAAWCDAVCAARGRPGDFLDRIWVQRHGSPPYYPDAVTLTVEGRRRQEDCIADLGRLRPGSLAVKDSFCGLELGPLGFEILFDASWIALSPAAPPTESGNAAWRRVQSGEDMRRWEAAWSGSGQIDEASRTFLPPLLSDPNIHFLLAFDKNGPIGGGVLNRAAGVVGLSNVFSRGMPLQSLWKDLIAQTAARFPDIPLVGYEHGDDLAMALQAGFETIGQLRVWLRP